MIFVRLTEEAYRDHPFGDINTGRRVGTRYYEIRLDDVFLAAAGAPAISRPVHYILHTAYCCSTLLAHYFELVPACFVLNEPQVLAQLAIASAQSISGWKESLDVCLRLLTRTFNAEQMPIIKMHVPCNVLGGMLLDCNERATVTYLTMPLNHFLLAVLKSEMRRGRVRYWTTKTASVCPRLADINLHELGDSEVAVCFWLLNRYLCDRLVSSSNMSRVVVADGEKVAESPSALLPAILEKCGLNLDDEQMSWLLDHPSLQWHAKDRLRPFNPDMRRREMAVLQGRFGREVDAATEWASSKGLFRELETKSQGVTSCGPRNPK